MKRFLIFLMLLAVCAKAQVPIEIPTRETGELKYLKAFLFSNDTNVQKPVILVQTPYNKELAKYVILFPQVARQQIPVDLETYNYVVTDWRGFYSNSDKAIPAKNLGEDGYDAVEWIAVQKWSNGKIATWGPSALGHIQFLTAAENPPHLVCCVPMVRDYMMQYEDFFDGGAFKYEYAQSLVALGFYPSVTIFQQHPRKDSFWKLLESGTDLASKINVPMLLVGGWFDHEPDDMLRAFDDLRNKSGESVRGKHCIVMGPWAHERLGIAQQEDMYFPASEDYAKEVIDRFFKVHLLGFKIAAPPTFQFYQMNEDKWITEQQNLTEGCVQDTIYFREDKGLNFLPPPPKMGPMKEMPDTIVYDPRNPVPTIGGQRFSIGSENQEGPSDVTDTLLPRPDALTYMTEPLDKDLVVRGKINIQLFIRSNRKDTDFMASICQVSPDGTVIVLRHGAMRARFRESLEYEKFLELDSIYPVNIEIEDMAITFPKGYKLAVLISSSNYPMFDLNPNTGDPLYQFGDTLVAENYIYRDAEHLSRITFNTPSTTDIESYHQFATDFVVFPNPVKESFEILSTNAIDKVEVYTTNGRKLMMQKTNKPVSVLQFAPGSYIVKIFSGKNVIVRRFIKL